MGQYVTKQEMEDEKYKLILEIDELQIEVAKLRKELYKKEQLIQSLRYFNNDLNADNFYD